MRQQRIKVKKWHVLSTGIAVLGMVCLWNLPSTALKAETGTSLSKSQESETAEKGNVSSRLGRALTTVTNEQGLSATPKVVTISQNGAFPTVGTSTIELGKLVTGLTIPAPSTGITFEYVNASGSPVTPSSGTVGFQTVYIKVTEKTGSTSIVVPIPVNITDTTTTSVLSSQAMIKADSRIILYPDETKGKTNQELQALIQSKANLSAWNMSNGESVPVSATATTAVNNTVGSYTVTFTVNLNGTTASATRNVTIFGAAVKTPYYFTAAQDATINLGSSASAYFSKYQTVTTTFGGNATYEWVADQNGTSTTPANTFDTSQPGFKWGYIKMTDKADTTISTVMKVPMTITNDNVQVIDGKIGYGTPRGLNIIKASEVSGNTATEIGDNLVAALELKAWDLVTGVELPMTITNLGGLTATSGIGKYDMTLQATLADSSVKTVKRSYTLLADSILGDTLDGWATIPLNATNGVIENPINKSKLGFISRGMSASGPGGGEQQGFVIRDSTYRSYVFRDGKVSAIPFADGKVVYASEGYLPNTANTFYGLGVRSMSHNLISEFYLKKGNALRQILVDKGNQLVYVYDLGLSRNLNFSVNLSMFNTSESTRQLAMLESVDTDYYSDHVPIYAAGDNSGFYMEPSAGKRFTIKLKDSKGQNLSDYTLQAPGIYGGSNAVYPNAPYSLNPYNWFLGDFSRKGIERYNYPKGQIIVQNSDSMYQLGAPYRPVETNKALKAGYEVFAGSELPYMRLTSVPEEWNIYQDNKATSFETDYNLASIPHIGGHGTISVEYPNQEKLEIPFVADENLEFNGKLSIPRRTLPAQLNEESGTIKSYSTSMLAIHETEGPMVGLPSNDYAVKVNVYNIGGKGVAQTVQKDSTWSKTAKDLIKDPVILPGNTALYEFVDGQPDTSKLGLQIVKVRMTDKEQPSQTTIIEVPVNVITGTPPTTGLTVAANDFTVTKAKLAGLSDEAIKALILKESNAKGWDNATGLMTNVALAVKSTTLTATPTNKQYTATIQGTKDSLTGEAVITITIKDDIAAQSVAQSIPLGTDETYWKEATLKGTVKDIKVGGNIITDYTVTLVTPPITNRITTDSSMKVKVASVADPTATIEIDVPVNVTWGNSVALGGSGTSISSGQSTLALTLHEDNNGKPYLSSTYGNLPKSSENTALASGADAFYQVTYLDMSSQGTGQNKAKEVNDGPNAVNEVSLQAIGSQTPAQLVNTFGTNGKLSVNYGDILKVYGKQGQHALYAKNNGPSQPIAGLPNSETLFVVVTKDGFTPIYLNQLMAKEVSINSESTATTTLYDAHYNSIANYFTVNGASSNYTRVAPNGFKSYPRLNLAVGERDSGTVLVAEPTSATSNQYLTYAYNTIFVGGGPEMQIVAPLSNLSFGTQTIKSYKQEIKRTDPNWGFTVLDSRQTKDAWVIQAKISQPFQTTGANPKALKGAELRVKQGSETISLNSGYQTIYAKNNPTASNNVTWTSDKGFFLQVPPGEIDKDASYSSEVEFILTNAP